MCHEENLDLFNGTEHHLYRLVAIHWVVEAGLGLVDLLYGWCTIQSIETFEDGGWFVFDKY